MHRDAEKDLIIWKDTKERYPLLVRGARQVGKSFLVESFGKKYFQNNVTINFEFQPQLKNCFTSLDPQEIINKMQLMLGVRITKDTLIFLDEIQECPNAIIAMRYFKERAPEFPIIGAGSLLEFALRSEDFKMPIGRIQFLFLEPLSFSEFLEASDNIQLREHLTAIKINDSVDVVIHQKLLELLRYYLILGGMPAVLKEYLSTKDLLNCQHLQTSILQTYRTDFGKYAKIVQHKYLQKVFDAAPRLVGQIVKYTHIDPNIKSRELKSATELLTMAGIIRQIFTSKASGIPLGAQIDEQKFKLNFLDIGLMQNVCGLQAQLGIENDFMQINSGAVAEQFVGQELRAYSDRYQPANLFFWARNEKNSSAEIDYVVGINNQVIPIEVKAGKTGTLRSLKIFLEEKKARFGIRISQEPLSYYDRILSIPLYMVEQLPRLAQSILDNIL